MRVYLPPPPPESLALSRKAKTLTLTAEERCQLTRIDERGSDWRERRRARTILLLDQGLSIDAVVTQQKIARRPWPATGMLGWFEALPDYGTCRAVAPRASYRKPFGRCSAPGHRMKPVRPLS